MTERTDAMRHDPGGIRREMRVYIAVFGGLAVLTAMTVWACYGLRLPLHFAIGVALTIAAMKAFLVAGFFMHLLSERKVVYGVVALTAVLFAALVWLPLHDILDKF